MSLRFPCARVLAGAALVLLCGTASAMQHGKLTTGGSYVCGGVTDEERRSLEAQRDDFSLWILTAARRTGAYLADVKIRVVDDHQATVFDSRMDGPWLMLALPLGRYTLEASFQGQVQQRVTTIHPADHHQAIFYFDAEGDVLPPSPPPKDENARKGASGAPPAQ